MKTVVISGYYGFENLGDEALLMSMITALKTRRPELNIIVLSAKPDKTKRLYGVEAVYRWDPLAVASALKRADLLLSGGGSLLQDVTGRLTIPYYLGIVWAAKLMGKKAMFYAQGIGPVNGWIGRNLVRFIANKVDFITLRDNASASLLEEIGVCKPPIEITADPVFGVSAGSNHYDSNTGTKNQVGIFVREWKEIEGYKKAVAGTADHLIRQGQQVFFIPMQYPEDVRPIHEIIAMMENEPVVVEKEFTFPQLIDVIKEFGLVIGMRLHALIIAALCNVPMVGLSYDPKVSDFMESIGQPIVTDLTKVTAEDLIDKVKKVSDNSENIRDTLKTQCADLQYKALRNSEIAVELLK